ncbi:MAG: hypothetical protein AB7K52_00065 [Phycisphaerales bacterium]
MSPFAFVIVVAGALALGDQSSPRPAAESAPAPAALAPPTPDELAGAISRSVELLLSMQESLDGDAERAEWPYEGVYRVNRAIPIGYRVGGTAISAIALLRAPGYADDQARHAAVERALRFVCARRNHPLMSAAEYEGGYDVRAWGYVYAILFIAELRGREAVPESLKAESAAALTWYVQSLEALELPETGGWNYARPQGRENIGAPSPFMTAPALQALFLARSVGEAVDEAIITRALATLEKGRTAAGGVNYSGAGDGRRQDRVPGAVGRMLATETTLALAGRNPGGSVAGVRAALDAFLVHWKWLESRRQQPGTHVAPYGVAPYYFMYAHAAAGQAIELLPPGERAEYRERFLALLFSVRENDGSWNDRVFKRSANYGTACALFAMTAPEHGPGPKWRE